MTLQTYAAHPAFDDLTQAINELDRDGIAAALRTLDTPHITKAEKTLLRDRLTSGVKILADTDMESLTNDLNPEDAHACGELAGLVVSDLLKAGADPLGGGSHPILNALGNGNWAMVVPLVKSGANPRMVLDAQSDISVAESVLQAPAHIALLLLEMGVKPAGPREKTMEKVLTSRGVWDDAERAEICTKLVSMGFKIPQDGVLLVKAAGAGYSECVQMLLDAGVNPGFHTTGEVHTMFRKAVSDERGTLESHIHSGYTALHHASLNGQTGTALRLINAGAPLNAVTDHEVSALHLAALHSESANTVRVLLAAGIPFDQKDHQGRTPLDWAKPNSPAAHVLEQAALQATVETGRQPSTKERPGL